MLMLMFLQPAQTTECDSGEGGGEAVRQRLRGEGGGAGLQESSGSELVLAGRVHPSVSAVHAVLFPLKLSQSRAKLTCSVTAKNYSTAFCLLRSIMRGKLTEITVKALKCSLFSAAS